MLPSNRRIERQFFSQIMANSKRYHSTSFVLYQYQIKDKPSTPSKFSFSVSKKILKSAVQRNKQRRRGYSIIKKYIKSAKPGFLCFFVYKKGFLNDLSDLEKDIKGLLSQSGMII